MITDYSYVLYHDNVILATFCGPLRLAELCRGEWPTAWTIERFHSAVTSVGMMVTPAEVLAHADDVRAQLSAA